VVATFLSSGPTYVEEGGDDVENDVEADAGHDGEDGRGLDTAG